MEMKIAATSFGFKVPLPNEGSFGVTIANGVLILIRQGLITRTFVISKPVSFGKDGVFGGALLGTEWFKVKDPEKGILIADFNNKLADLTLSSGVSKVDVSLKIYDENNQPWYSMERVDVDVEGGASTTGFKLRGNIKQSKTIKGQIQQTNVKGSHANAK